MVLRLLEAGLGHRRDLGQRRKALDAGDGQRAHLAGLQVRQLQRQGWTLRSSSAGRRSTT
jgi:hypothetical protein